MKLYNTLTRTVEQIKPLTENATTVYTCGPTVYDYPHVGNWFTFIRYDVLIRTLQLSGMQPKWVMNITDVGHLVSDADEGEDKLEKGAKRDNKTAWDVAKHYGDYFIEGLNRLNISQPAYLPKATEHIPEQIALIAALEEKGYTYTIDDGVYYDTSRFEGYAAFARLDLDDLKAGARVEYNTQKKNPTDFALWKFSPKDTKRAMEWESPWGKGFPGWHLECSAMAMKYLGDTLDIHAGGIDHVPVHHTNEIAQSEAVTGKRFALTWMHTNHVTIEGDKISKSLGNGFTLEDIENHGYSLEAFRLHVLESHYRHQSKFSWDALEAAQNRLSHYQAMADIRWQPFGKEKQFVAHDDRSVMLADAQNDLNTPSILAVLSAAANEVLEKGIHQDEVNDFVSFLEFIDELLGLHLSNRKDITEEQKASITQREAAREQKDWRTSDKLRDKLAAEGIAIRDTPHGTIWNRTS